MRLINTTLLILQITSLLFKTCIFAWFQKYQNSFVILDSKCKIRRFQSPKLHGNYKSHSSFGEGYHDLQEGKLTTKSRNLRFIILYDALKSYFLYFQTRSLLDIPNTFEVTADYYEYFPPHTWEYKLGEVVRKIKLRGDWLHNEENRIMLLELLDRTKPIEVKLSNSSTIV